MEAAINGRSIRRFGLSFTQILLDNERSILINEKVNEFELFL